MKILSNNKGFTLIEVMVAVSIFTIILTVGIGALLTINNNYQKSQADREAIDSVTYVLESMSRRIRTAQEWGVGNTYGGTSSSFQFVDQDGISITYNLVGESIVTDIDNQQYTDFAVVDGSYNITPSNVRLSRLAFTAFQSATETPYVQINIEGKVVNGQESTPFALQTGISKRAK